MRAPFKFFFSVALLSVLLLAVFATTQEPKPSSMNIPYNPSQERTFSGTILEVKNYQCPVTGAIGSHIVVKGGSDTLEVHLAPVTFLNEYGIVLNPGDRVTVTGVKFTFQGKPAMLAGSVVDGLSTFTFRDAKGRPEW